MRCDKENGKRLILIIRVKSRQKKSNAKGENKEKPVCTLSRETHTMKVCMLRSLPLPPKLGLSRLAPPPPPPPQHLHTFPFVWTGPSSLQFPSRMRCECTNKPPPLHPPSSKVQGKNGGSRRGGSVEKVYRGDFPRGERRELKEKRVCSGEGGW